MTPRQLERLAVSSGMVVTTFDNGVTHEFDRVYFDGKGVAELTKFAALVRAAAIEEAAKALDEFNEQNPATFIRELI